MSVLSRIISEAADRMDLSGKSIMVHSSFRSFGPIPGGPQAVIDGLLKRGCTVMVPTFSMVYEIAPPDGDHILRNGIDYETYRKDISDSNMIYRSDSNEVGDSMGAIPKCLLSINGRYRGNHPRCSFAAVGPKAEELIAAQSPFDGNGPIKKLSDLNGLVVLMGVGLSRMTALHKAEEMSGRKPFIRWVNGVDGKPIRVDFGSCSDGFDNLGPVLNSIENRTRVGSSLWRVFPVTETLRLAADAMINNPMIANCGRDCLRCEDVIAGGPVFSPA